MKAARIAPLVEGDGEVTAVPVLLRRMIQDIDRTVTPIVRPGFPHPSGSMLRIGGLERAISAVAEIHPAHAVLVIIDTDDHCPKQLGPSCSFAQSQPIRPGSLCRVGSSRV